MRNNRISSRRWEYIFWSLLFLFSISVFNLAGYIFPLLLIFIIFICYDHIPISVEELCLFIFSISYFWFYYLNYDTSFKDIILYLVGPWGAYVIGKMYVIKSQRENARLISIVIISIGMFMHGVLNWIEILKSAYMSSYEYQRIAIDFWRKEIVSVTVTGMFFTFATAVAIAGLFANVKKIYKVLACIVLTICLSATVFFANRTLLFIVLIIFGYRILMEIFGINNNLKKRLEVVFFLSCIIIVVGVLIVLNVGGIKDAVLSLKIVGRLSNKNSDGGRVSLWLCFFEKLLFLDFLWGGKYISKSSGISYMHNLWLDVYDTVGIIPSINLLIFTIMVCVNLKSFFKKIKRRKDTNTYICIQSLFFAIFLNCMVEPIIEANPYYFLCIIMMIGIIKGYELKGCKNES